MGLGFFVTALACVDDLMAFGRPGDVKRKSSRSCTSASS